MNIAKRKTFVGLKFLSFILSDEEYCIEILKVREIMGITGITVIPQTPDFIKGVINLRGKIIPIIDLRLKFGMPARTYNNRTCIVVVEIEFEHEQTYMGLVVDTIKEVISIPEERITRIPYINDKIQSDFVKGIAEMENDIKIILDIIKILTEEEFVLIRKIDINQLGDTKINEEVIE